MQQLDQVPRAMMRGSEVVDGDAFGKIEGILKDDRGWRARHGLQKVNTNYISGPGMIIGVVDANRECNLSWVKDGWIYRFFPAPAVG
jgi:hypothetical protein